MMGVPPSESYVMTAYSHADAGAVPTDRRHSRARIAADADAAAPPSERRVGRRLRNGSDEEDQAKAFHLKVPLLFRIVRGRL